MGQEINIIVAFDENMGIGKDDKLLWNLGDDMKHFKNTTNGHTVIMGRKTYESIPKKFRPLPNRVNIVITRNPDYEDEGAIVVNSPEKAIEKAKEFADKVIFITGGGEIYKAFLNQVDKIIATKVKTGGHLEHDTYFPELKGYRILSSEFHQSDDRNEYDFSIDILVKE